MMCYSNEDQLFQSFDLSLQKRKKKATVQMQGHSCQGGVTVTVNKYE